MDRKKLGQFGEDIICDYLRKKGYKILDRNYIKIWNDKLKGEIDIITKKDGIVCFIEVKTVVAGNEDFLPEDKVNYKKQKKLIKLAQTWLLEKKISLDSFWQIDVASVSIDKGSKKARIRYFQNAVGS